MTLRHEGQYAAFAFDPQAVRVCHDFDVVQGLFRKAVDGVEHLEGADQVEFIDWRHHDDDVRRVGFFDAKAMQRNNVGRF